MLVRDQHYENVGRGPTIRSRKLLRVKAEPQTLFLKAERKGRESELIYGRVLTSVRRFQVNTHDCGRCRSRSVQIGATAVSVA